MPTLHIVPGSTLPAEARSRIVKVTEAYVAAANALDAVAVVAMLADDVVYDSQWTRAPIQGRQVVGDYIAAKYLTMRRSEAARPEFRLGRIDLQQGADYPVALVTQFGKAEAFVALSVDASGRIVSHDILGLTPPASRVRICEEGSISPVMPLTPK